jgi:hypothetical protein
MSDNNNNDSTIECKTPFLYTKSRDIVFLFIMVCVITIGMMGIQYGIAARKLSIEINNSGIFQLPIDILANCLMVFIGIYFIGNGGRSFLNMAKLPEEAPNSLGEIPIYKQKQMFAFVIAIIILTIVAGVMQGLVGEDPSFALKEFVTALSSTVISYVIARTGSKLGECVYITPNNKKEVEETLPPNL